MSVSTNEKISFREKFCYGLGDASLNIFMGFTMMFLTIFYTDVFKLNPAVMGTLFLAVRFIDAISDPMCGMISDRTKSSKGRYRPWLLYAAIPYGLSCAALFLCPDLSETGKAIYAYTTYIFLTLSVTCVMVPYVSLLGAISDDSAERISINTIRFPLNKIAYIVCSLFIPLLIAKFTEAGHTELGYRVVMSGIGFCCVIMVLLCYFNTKERVYTPIDNSMTFFEQIKLMFKNDQALIMFLGQLSVMIVNTLKFGAAAYFVKYIICNGQEDSNGLLATMLTSGSVAGIIAPFIANYILKNRLMKRSSFLMWSQILAGIFMLLLAMVQSDGMILNVSLFFLSLLTGELVGVLIWASVADCSDYQYYRDGVRLTGIISGGMLFSTKLGLALGGAILGYILAAYDYNPDAASVNITEDQRFCFFLLFAILPAVFSFIAGIIFKFYKLEADVCDHYKDMNHKNNGSKGSYINDTHEHDDLASQHINAVTE